MPTTSPPILVWQPGGGTPPGEVLVPKPPITNAALTQLVNGQDWISVTFDTAQVDNTWIFVECSVLNTTDPTPLNIWPGITTVKTSTGFRIYLNGNPDSSNYFLNWAISGVNIPPPVPFPATTYTLTGPTSGNISVASTAFTVKLPAGSTVATPVVVTPHDGGGGTFTPATVTLTTGAPSATFTYTPASYGAKTISTTNDGGLADPGSLTYSVFATTYTLTGPSSGAPGVPSTNFTVALPAGGVVTGTITITPLATGGGTFTPTTVGLTTGSPSATFTYTPTSIGAKTISTTNNGSLTDPASLTYTAAIVQHLLNTLISYWKLDEVSGNRADSQGTNTLTPTNAPVGAAGVINNGAQFVAASSQYLTVADNSSLRVASDFTFSLWIKLASVSGNYYVFSKGVAGNEYSLFYFTGTGLGFYVNHPVSIPISALAPVLTAGVWYHAVCWWDSVAAQVFLRLNDTTTYQSSASTGLDVPSIASFDIGQSGTGASYLDGIVDEVGFWKRKLTAGEITSLYNGGTGLPFGSFLP